MRDEFMRGIIREWEIQQRPYSPSVVKLIMDLTHSDYCGPLLEGAEVSLSLSNLRNLEQVRNPFRDLKSYNIIQKPVPWKVIFHDPATIVFWNDGTKTVVKCQEGDTYDREAGLAMCYMKKVLGSSRAFNDILKFADPDCGDQVYVPTDPR